MRIVCLSAEAADVCARLGAWEEVVAVSAFASQEGLSRRPVIGGSFTVDAERIREGAGALRHLFDHWRTSRAEALAT